MTKSPPNISLKPGPTRLTKRWRRNSVPETRLSRLLDRVQVALSWHGAQKDLHMYLGVSRQSLHRWLVGDCEPKGEFVLGLLEWVLAEEARRQSR